MRSDGRIGPIPPRPDRDWRERATVHHRQLHGRRFGPGLPSRYGVFDDPRLHLDQLRGVFDHARLGIAAVSLTRQLLERVMDSGSCPVRAVPVDAQLGGQFVCRLEADPTDVVGQLVRVLP